ncbi:hypothetical protein [Dermatobacter hominis]|uniref:hypothetical protein n=1 Tax=Dermatobacter hominis TaxID=2884263 RepID=UPI001D1228E6|nr:hypothetical protein [Dermatobacter hominis]UDY36986.1 hypothetical protein LH044_05475 [Dermatobacter hominis]
MLVVVVLVVPWLLTALSFGFCTMPSGGEYDYGTMRMSVVPYGPVCEDVPTQPSVSFGPSLVWTVVPVVGALVAVVSVVVIGVRARPIPTAAVDRGSWWDQVGAWAAVGVVGGGAASAAIVGGGATAVAVADHAFGPGSGPGILESGLFGTIVGGIVGVVAGLVLGVLVAGFVSLGETRRWPSTPGSYAVVAASLSGPASLVVLIPALGFMNASGWALALPLAVSAVVAVLAAPAGWVAWRLVERMISARVQRRSPGAGGVRWSTVPTRP